MASLVHQEPENVECAQKTEYGNRQEEPVSAHPEDGSRIIIVPGGAFVNSEKAPWVFVVSMLQLALNPNNRGKGLQSPKR